MTSKKLLNRLFLLLLLSGIVFACVNDDPFDDSGRQNNGNRGRRPLAPEAAAAQEWFKNEVGREFLTWHPGTDEVRMLMPNWHRTLSNENSVFRVTEARLQGNRNFYRVAAESAARFRQTGNERYLVSDTRFVLRTHIETGETDGFIMKVYPDLEQIQRSRNPLRSFTYLKRDSDFSGFIYFYDLNGEFVNGWWQVDGRFYPIYTLAMVEKEPQLRSVGWRCYELWQVTRIYIGGELMSERREYVRTNCVPIGAPWIPPPFPGDNAPWPPSLGVGGMTGNVSTIASVVASVVGVSAVRTFAPNAAGIFGSARRTAEDWLAMERQINNMMQDCMGTAMYNGLRNRATNLNFQFITGRSGNYHGGTISVGRDMGGSGILFHEMFHAYQPRAMGLDINQRRAIMMNLEVETWLAKYHYVQRNADAETAWVTHLNNSDVGRAVEELARHIDHRGRVITNEIDARRAIDNFVTALRYVRGPSGSTPYANILFDESQSIADMFSNMNRLFSGCD